MVDQFVNFINDNQTLVILANSLEHAATILMAFRKTHFYKLAEWVFYPKKIANEERNADGPKVYNISIFCLYIVLNWCTIPKLTFYLGAQLVCNCILSFKQACNIHSRRS